MTRVRNSNLAKRRSFLRYPPSADTKLQGWYEEMADAIPIRVQRHRTKGWRMPPNTVSVTRPGRYGNPFNWRDGLEISGGNEEWAKAVAVDMCREWLRHPECFPDLPPPPTVMEIKAELRGKNLACFCRETDPCHADLYLAIANS
jgi:hypothetical protein